MVKILCDESDPQFFAAWETAGDAKAAPTTTSSSNKCLIGFMLSP